MLFEFRRGVSGEREIAAVWVYRVGVNGRIVLCGDDGKDHRGKSRRGIIGE